MDRILSWEAAGRFFCGFPYCERESPASEPQPARLDSPFRHPDSNLDPRLHRWIFDHLEEILRWKRTTPSLDRPWRLLGETRERYWRGKLGRIRLGVEPIEEQMAKYRA